LLSVPIAEYPYGRAFDPFLKFQISELIAVTSRQLVLLCLDVARNFRSIPEREATRPVPKGRTAIAFSARIQLGEREYAPSPPCG
jgi:hypothetical protein